MTLALVVSFRGDIHAEALLWAAEREGLDPLFLDVYRIFDNHRIALHHSGDGDNFLTLDGARIDAACSTVLRRPYPGEYTAYSFHPADVAFAAINAKQFYAEVLNYLSRATFCIDPISAIRAADRKHRQLQIARAVGFYTPPTLMTNDPQAARAFIDGRRTISKSFRPFQWHVEGRRFGAAASLLTEDVLNRAEETICACPPILQEMVDSIDEIRVVVIGRNIFAASLGWSNQSSGGVDWRKQTSQLSVRRTHLPADLCASILAFMDRMGMRYGAFDFIRTTDGYVFLEFNPAGQWLWMSDERNDLPLLDCFAKFLRAQDDDYVYDEAPAHFTHEFREQRGDRLIETMAPDGRYEGSPLQSIIATYGATSAVED